MIAKIRKINLFRTLDVSRLNHSALSLFSVLLVSLVALSGFVWMGGEEEDETFLSSGDFLTGFAPAPTTNLKIGKLNRPFYSSLAPNDVGKKPVYTDLGETQQNRLFRLYLDSSTSTPAGHSAPVLQGYFLPVQNSFVDKYGNLKKEFSSYLKPVYRVNDRQRSKVNPDYYNYNVAGKVEKVIIGYVGSDTLKKLDTKNQLVELKMSDEQFKKDKKEGRNPSKSLGWFSKTKNLELEVPSAPHVAGLPKQLTSSKKVIANFMFDDAVYFSLAPVVPKNPLFVNLGETKENPFFRTYFDTLLTPPAGHTSPTFKGYLIPKNSVYADRYYNLKKVYTPYLQPLYRVKGALRKGGKETDYIYQVRPGKVDKTLIGFIGTDELKKHDTKNKLVRLVAPSDQVKYFTTQGWTAPTTLGWISTSKGGLEAVENEIVPVPPEQPDIVPFVPPPSKPEPPKLPVVLPQSNSEITFSLGDKVFVGPSKQGEKRTFMVDGKEYEVEVVQISDKEKSAQLRINGKLLPKMKVGQSGKTEDGLVTKLLTLYPIGKTPTPTPLPTITPTLVPIKTPTKTITPLPSPDKKSALLETLFAGKPVQLRFDSGSNSRVVNGVVYEFVYDSAKKYLSVKVINDKGYSIFQFPVLDLEKVFDNKNRQINIFSLKIGFDDKGNIWQEGGNLKGVYALDGSLIPTGAKPTPTATPLPSLTKTLTPIPTKTSSPTQSPEPEIVISIGDAVVAGQK